MLRVERHLLDEPQLVAALDAPRQQVRDGRVVDPAHRDGKAIGWGEVDDEEPVAAVHAGIAAGINIFDTANVYGTGHSERVLAMR